VRSTAYRTPFNKTIPENHGIVNGPTVHNHPAPFAEWKLTKIAQFWKIDEAGNMTRSLRENQQE
jgi:hypothetical protein